MTVAELRALAEPVALAWPPPWTIQEDEYPFVVDADGASVCETYIEYTGAFIAAANPAVVAALCDVAEAAESIRTESASSSCPICCATLSPHLPDCPIAALGVALGKDKDE